MKRVLIIGATSAIAEATARLLAARGDALFLVARNFERLQAIADDLRIRGAASVHIAQCDVCDRELIDAALMGAVLQHLKTLDIALIAHGTLPDQAASEASVSLMRQGFGVNALSVMSLCTQLANYFEAQKSGVIAVISSVAGERGRRSNYVYGAAKAAITAFTSGLRQRLYSKGVAVVTIKPGFVSTPMTAAFRKSALWATPAQVARKIVRAIDRGTPVVYAPWFWRPIMRVIRALPEGLFRRLKM